MSLPFAQHVRGLLQALQEDAPPPLIGDFSLNAANVLSADTFLRLGLTRLTALRHVIGPQAIRISLPPMTNDFIALLKDSSLVSVITVVELTKQTSIFAANIGSWVVPGIMCAAMYLALSLPLARLARRIEKGWKRA